LIRRNKEEAAKESPIEQNTNRDDVQDFLSFVNNISPKDDDHLEGLYASQGDAKIKYTNDLQVFQQEL
jgi:hypothetical protein